MATNPVLANSLIKPRFRKKAAVKYRGALLGSIILGIISLSIADSSRDFVGYDNYFDDLRVYGTSMFEFHRFEPLFGAVSLPLVQLLSSNLLVYTGILMVAVYLKFRVFSQLSSNGIVVLAIYIFYVAHFAFLHELTQMRIALALAIWMYALTQTQQRKFWLLLVVFPLVHYSTLILVPITLAWYLLCRNPDRYLKVEVSYWLITASLIVGSVFILSAIIEYLATISIAVSHHQANAINTQPVNIQAIPVLVDIAFLIIFSITGLVVRTTPKQRFWLWMQFIGTVLFYAFSEFPVFAHRIHEMFNLSWVFYLIFTLPNRSYLGKLALIYWTLCIPMYVYIYLIRMSIFHINFSWLML